MLAQRPANYFGIIMALNFTEKAHQEADTCPYPIKLSYINTIVKDIKELVESNLAVLRENNEIIRRMRQYRRIRNIIFLLDIIMLLYIIIYK